MTFTSAAPHLLSARMARLLEGWADLAGVRLSAMAPWRSRQPTSHMYSVGEAPQDVADIALDVGAASLDYYRGLGVPREVWLWDGWRIAIWAFALRGTPRDYVRVVTSPSLPGLDLRLIERCMEPSGHAEALMALESWWRNPSYLGLEAPSVRARPYVVHLWFGELDSAEVPYSKRGFTPHLDPRGRPIVNGPIDLTPAELVWLSERYDVMLTPTGDEGDTMLALSPRGHKFGQR